jgi:hypothetical protein
MLTDLAEGEGFEPSVTLLPHLFSRQASSTTPAPFRTAILTDWAGKWGAPAKGLVLIAVIW